MVATYTQTELSAITDFLSTVVTYSPQPTTPETIMAQAQAQAQVLAGAPAAQATPAYFLLAFLDKQGRNWHEEWFTWGEPNTLTDIATRALETRDTYNVYFSTYLFDTQSSARMHVLPTRTIQADLDDADINTLPVEPTVLVTTSPGRHQAYWLLDQTYSVLKPRAGAAARHANGQPQEPVMLPPFLPLASDVHEALSRKLTYAIGLCDHSGWPLGRKVRVPFTYNHKYASGPHLITVASVSTKPHYVNDIELLPEIDDPLKTQLDIDFLTNEHGITEVPEFIMSGGESIGPFELLEEIKPRIPGRVYGQYAVRSKDRSTALWALQLAAFRAGLNREQVFFLAWHSANNKWADLISGAERELAKDTLRAEAMASQNVVDARQAVMDIRKLPGIAAERRQYMFRIVLDRMQQEGEFIRCDDDNAWYIRSDLGRPIAIAPHSDYLNMILDLQFGLNSVETEQSYVVSSLGAYARSLPVTGKMSSLSYFDTYSHSILIHTGKRDVVRITASDITQVANGAYGVVFPWGMFTEPFVPELSSTGSEPLEWADLLFEGALDTVIGGPKAIANARALLQTWVLFLLLRNAAMTRPLVAFLGQPGGGKTTLFKRVYALVYGRAKALSSITTQDDFDHAVSNDPLVVLDNVDTWERWLPDRLALSIAANDIQRRKLYTDRDLVVIKRQALLGISAHNPRFGRPDVADRMLIVNFQRLSHFGSETNIVHSLLANRNYMWGSIIHDLQRVLQTPYPTPSEIPQLRVEDFARIGYWIAKALGYPDEFRAAVLDTQSSQANFALDEDAALVSALEAMCLRQSQSNGTAHMPEWHTSQQMYTRLQAYSTDFTRVYKNPVSLSRKMFAMYPALKSQFDIEWRVDSGSSTRLWRIGGRLQPATSRMNGGS